MEVILTHIVWKRILTSLVSLLLADVVWFRYSIQHVYPTFPQSNVVWGLVAWIALAIAISAGKPDSVKTAGLWGAVVGAIAYAVFNGTELAIRTDWSPSVALVDTLWGIGNCSVSSVALYWLGKK